MMGSRKIVYNTRYAHCYPKTKEFSVHGPAGESTCKDVHEYMALGLLNYYNLLLRNMHYPSEPFVYRTCQSS